MMKGASPESPATAARVEVAFEGYLCCIVLVEQVLSSYGNRKGRC